MADDIRLDAAQLLGELEWLRRLARGLVGGDGVEQDLVQQTWLAATRVEGGVSRPWLVGTLRRLAARWRRSESRLRRREEAVARPEAVDTTALLDRSELFGTVLEELRAMEEPFRTTLILLYQEGLDVRESAQSLGVPEDTLRWRHREGLKRLRSRMDREARSDWRAALMPFLGHHIIEAGAAGAATAGTSTVIWGSIMSLKIGTVAAAVTILVPLALLVLGENPQAPARSVADREAPALQLLEAPVTAEVTPEDSGRRSVTTDPGERRARTASAPPASGRVLAVTVVGERNNPVPGARVWFGDDPDPAERFWESNAEGVALLPMPEATSAEVSGNAPGLYGRRWFFPEMTGGELRLRILPDADLRVVVVDEQGAPVDGAPVGLIRTKTITDRVTKTERDILGFFGIAETDDTGHALLRHVNYQLRMGKTASWAVGPAVLLRSRSDVPLTLGDLPEEPVRLVLPPVGPLTVRVNDDTGVRNKEASEVRVLIDPRPWEERDVPALVNAARFSPRGIVTVETRDGIGEIPMVGLGLKLLAEAREAEPTGSTLGLGPGPETAEEGTELVLEPRDEALELVGYALDAAGTPLARAELTGEITFTQGKNFSSSKFRVRSDSEGRFRIFLDERARIDWGRYEVRTLHLLHMGSDPMDVLAANRLLPEMLERGANDVGELNLEPLTPLLAGAARTEDGDPVDIEYIFLEIRDVIEDRRVRLALDARQVIAGDRFALYGDVPELHPELGQALELQITSTGRPGRKQRVAPGDLDLSFVFEEAGYLAGRVLLEPDHDFQDYEVRFRTREEAGDYFVHQPVELAQNGRFRLSGLPRQAGDLEVRDWDTQTLLAIVPDIEPADDADLEHPRLAGIELEVSVEEYSLLVTDAEGEGLRDAAFDSPRLPLKRTSFGAGQFRWRAAGSSLDGIVSAPGYRAQRVTLTPGDRVVVLERGPEVTVRLVPDIELPDGARLDLQLVGGEWTDRISLDSLESGVYSGFVSATGEYQVRGRLQLKGVLVAELPLGSSTGSGIQISGTEADRAIEVRVDGDAILARLEER